MLIWISTTVDVRTLAAGQANGPAGAKEFPGQMTAEQVAALEQELASNPEGETTRAKLIRYYAFNNPYDRRIPLVLWLIDHHPESELLGEPSAIIFPQLDGPNAYEDARNHWLTQVSLHPNDARVLLNAAHSRVRQQARTDRSDAARPETRPRARNRAARQALFRDLGVGHTNPVSRRRSETSCGVRTILRWSDRWLGSWWKVRHKKRLATPAPLTLTPSRPSW